MHPHPPAFLQAIPLRLPAGTGNSFAIWLTVEMQCSAESSVGSVSYVSRMFKSQDGL